MQGFTNLNLFHKGIEGTREYNEANNTLHGRLLVEGKQVTYVAKNTLKLQSEFINEVDKYLLTLKTNKV